MEPSSPLSTFMSNLLQECGCSSIEVTSDNAMTPLNSRTIVLQDHDSSNDDRSHRSCRWGNASPASVTDNIHLSPTRSYDKSSRWEERDVGHASPYYDHNPSPNSSRWDLDADDRVLNISSPSLPTRKEDDYYEDRGRLSLKEQASRIAQMSRRKTLPQNWQALPY
jgi:hypothetical protein